MAAARRPDDGRDAARGPLRIEAFDTDAAVTATELLRFGHSWAAVHAARPSAGHPVGRYLLTLTPKAYTGTGVRAVHPDQ
ncbi:hypothetical protein ACFVTC_20815 [Streptomyces sp. NPDC057950]|uniref:hypothetical protein n=1 Tax=Streptomyces sp. NPDC057950 TaxID=3346288 RepID=UPI0036EB490F